MMGPPACRLGGGASPPKRALGVGPACAPGHHWPRRACQARGRGGRVVRPAGRGGPRGLLPRPAARAGAGAACIEVARPAAILLLVLRGQAPSGPGPGLGLGASHGAGSRLRRFEGRSIDGRARSSFAGVIGLLLMLQRATGKEKGHLKAHHDDAAEDASCMLLGHWTSTMPPQFLRCHCLHAPPPLRSQLAARKPHHPLQPRTPPCTQRHQRIAGVRKHQLTAQLPPMHAAYHRGSATSAVPSFRDSVPATLPQHLRCN
jgi:hypothetical protein